MSYTESILTEDYANKFNECLLPGAGHLPHLPQSFKSDIDQDSVFTAEDLESRARNLRDDFKYPSSSFNPPIRRNFKDSMSRPLEFDEKDALNIERKYQEILKKRRNKADPYGSPVYQPAGSLYDEPSKPQDDQSTVFDDYSLEIRHKKNEIQKDLELERQRKGRRRSSSPNAFRSVIRSHNILDSLSPRETLERKVVDLDNLSSSVQKATLEHMKLCNDLQEMQHQLRKNEAEVRLSERMTQTNREKIENVTKELKAAEYRRDQTLRHLEMVNEELNLKRAKMHTLDNQVSRELAGIRRMEQYGIDKDEIENILKERDQLYEIVKRQENIQMEKYKLAQELDMVKDDLHLEQERARQHIDNLEDDLEASLRFIKELQFEKKELESHLEHTRHHLSAVEDQASKSAREVDQLKGEFQSKIRNKLDEYELDKERVEKELKKMEEEKSLDESNLKSHIEQIRVELKNTEKERHDLKEIVMELEDKLHESSLARMQMLENHELKLRQMENEKEDALRTQRKEMINEQRLLLEEQEIQFGFLKNKIQNEADGEIENMMRSIQIKDQELEQVSDQLRQVESDYKSRIERERSEHESHLHREKSSWEQHSVIKRNQEIQKIKEDFECQVRSLERELEQMKSTLKHKDNQINELENEVTNAKQETKKMQNKNMLQMKNMKEGVKQDTIKQLKDKYEKKMDSELIKVISQMDKKSAERLTKVINEKCVTEESEKRNKQILVKIVKTVTHEINEECRKMATLLNVQPRRVNHSNVSDDFSKSDNVITQALANLEACGSEIRNLVEELETKIGKLSDHISASEMKMEKEIKTIKQDLEEEKSKDVSIIRDNLLKEHLQEIKRLAKAPDVGLSNLLREKEHEISRLLAERQAWKEAAAIKLAEKFERIHQKKISELRNLLLKREKEYRQLKATGRRSNSVTRKEERSSSALDLETKDKILQSSPAKIISSLQESLEKLRNENTDLRHKIGRSDSLGRKSRLENHKGVQIKPLRSCSKSRER